MQQIFDQLRHFLQQGISAIFHFIELIWAWSAGQITKLTAVPWQEWPLLKQVVLILILVGVVWALYSAARELLAAGTAILGAFATLLGVMVQTLPSVLLAGVIALGGLWMMNHLDNSALRWPMALQQAPSPGNAAANPAPPANDASSDKSSPERSSLEKSPPSPSPSSPPQPQR